VGPGVHPELAIFKWLGNIKLTSGGDEDKKEQE